MAVRVVVVGSCRTRVDVSNALLLLHPEATTMVAVTVRVDDPGGVVAPVVTFRVVLDAEVVTEVGKFEVAPVGSPLTVRFAVHGVPLLPLKVTATEYEATPPAPPPGDTGFGLCAPSVTLLTLKASVNVFCACDREPVAVR